MHDALACEGEHPLGGGVLEVRGGRLHEGAAADEQRQPIDEVRGEVALGMGDEASQPACGEVVDRRRQRVRQRPRARLEKHPAPGAPERQRPQLGVVEALDDRLGDLTSGQHPGASPGRLQRGVELGHATRQLGDTHVVVVADVRGGAHEAYPIAVGLASHRDAVGEIQRAVVDSGEDVAVQVDQVTSEGGDMELSVVPIDKPDDVNVIVGQAHFIKTVEDLHEALVGTSPAPALRPRVLRGVGPAAGAPRPATTTSSSSWRSRNALAIGAGHVVRDPPARGLPGERPQPGQAGARGVPIYCATANPVEVLVAETEPGRGVVGVIDGAPPLGVETDADVTARKSLLRAIGYKL